MKLLPLLLVVCGALVTASLQAQTNYEPYTFRTLAGMANAFGSRDGTGSNALFNAPHGVAVDSTGNVYVADLGNNTIRKITPDGTVTTLAGSPGQAGSTDGTVSNARFNDPRGIVVDAAGNLYVSEFSNCTIRKITPAGVVTTLAGVATSCGNADGSRTTARFSFLGSLALDTSGNLIVADYGNGTVRNVTPAGDVTTITGSAGLGYVDGPVAQAKFNRPSGVAVDSSNNIYVTDEQNNLIRKISGGNVSTIAGTFNTPGSADGTGTAAQFSRPEGLAIDGAGNLYVADANNYTIRKITPAAVVTTLAGVPNSAGSTDGTGSAARFSGPFGIAVGPGSDVYVADPSNSTIRTSAAAAATCVAAPSGLVSWWAAEGNANDLQDGNNGTLQNGAAIVAGKVGQAFNFPTSGAYVDIPDAANLDSTTATWDFWLNTTQNSGQTASAVGVIGKHDPAGSTHGFTIILQSDGKITAQIKDANAGTDTNLTSTKIVNDGQFHHIALALQSGGTSVLYIDGAPEASAQTLSFTFGANPVRFGTMSDTFWTPFGGLIDEVQYFNRILSATEVQAIYNAQSAGICKQPAITSPLTATATVGRLFVYQIGAARASSVAVTGLPALGLSYYSSFGAIVGVPNGTGTAPLQVGLTATNSYGSASSNLTINVQSAPSSGPVIASSTSVTARAGQPFKYQTISVGGTPSARLSVTGLPPGITYDQVTGVISGTTPSAGSYSVGLTVTSGTFTTSATVEITFVDDLALPVIVSPSSASVTAGQPFSYTIAAPANTSSTDVTSFGLIGTLPVGLSFDAKTGTISGVYSGSPMHDGSATSSKDLSGGVITNVQLFATNSHGTTTSPLTFFNAPKGTVNISTRMPIGSGEDVLIGGFIITGNAPKRLLVRAIGPSLPVNGALPDPTLEIHDGQNVLGSNDNWRTNQEQEVKDTLIPPANDLEAAAVATLSPGSGYTAVVGDKNQASGIGLVELYDLGTAGLDSSSQSQLVEISTRGRVTAGDDNVMIGGFIVSGVTTKVLTRAIGPELAARGVQGALSDTVLELHNADGSLISSNDNWRDTQEQAIKDTTVPPTDDRESAIVASLNPGNYTAVVKGKDGATGVALVEVYVLQ